MTPKLKREGRKILFALALFFIILVLEKSGTLGAAFSNRWISLALYLVPYLIVGWPVLRKAVLGVKNRQMLDESFLMTLASIGAFVTGEAEEAAAVMLFYQVGEWFQDFAVGRSRKSISDLMDIAPDFANVEREDGTVEIVDPDDVEVGDILVIRPGEKIPVDAEVIAGSSLIHTAALTGEPVPRTASVGDSVISGCINGEGLIRVRAVKAYEDSTVARILELVETASEKKSRTENFITRFARWYTPIVVGAALALAILPSIITGEWMTWVYRACTFLVISCPCALVISVPLAFFGGIGAASRNGMLVKGSNYLEQLADLEVIVTDKTGTITEGTFRVTELRPAPGVMEEYLLARAAAAESVSTHPIALSIRDAYTDFLSAGTGSASPGDDVHSLPAVVSSKNIAGKGLLTDLVDSSIIAGNAALLASYGLQVPTADDPAATVCYIAECGRGASGGFAVGAEEQTAGTDPVMSAAVSEEGTEGSIPANMSYLGMILISDTVKKGAEDAISAMKKAGVREVIMLTGDRKEAAEAVASELGITGVFPELLPEDKVNKVEELLSGGRGKGTLAFVGDGINDAPVLTRADVGIAMGAVGSDAAIEAADVVIMDDNLARIPMVIGIARKTVRIARQNIVFALAVKLLILLLGALGYANMWMAVFADVGVAVLCILNSMRLLLIKRTIGT